MEAFVIKRDDGKYLSRNYQAGTNGKPLGSLSFSENIFNARIFRDKDKAYFVKDSLVDWEKCKVVKVKLEEMKKSE